jgi:hypothetical protein
MRLVGWFAGVLAIATLGNADAATIFCKSKRGALIVRDGACRKRETAVDLATRADVGTLTAADTAAVGGQPAADVLGSTLPFASFASATTFKLDTAGCAANEYKLVVSRSWGTPLPWTASACVASTPTAIGLCPPICCPPTCTRTVAFGPPIGPTLPESTDLGQTFQGPGMGGFFGPAGPVVETPNENMTLLCSYGTSSATTSKGGVTCSLSATATSQANADADFAAAAAATESAPLSFYTFRAP